MNNKSVVLFLRHSLVSMIIVGIIIIPIAYMSQRSNVDNYLNGQNYIYNEPLYGGNKTVTIPYFLNILLGPAMLVVTMALRKLDEVLDNFFPIENVLSIGYFLTKIFAIIGYLISFVVAFIFGIYTLPAFLFWTVVGSTTIGLAVGLFMGLISGLFILIAFYCEKPFKKIDSRIKKVMGKFKKTNHYKKLKNLIAKIVSWTFGEDL